MSGKLHGSSIVVTATSKLRFGDTFSFFFLPPPPPPHVRGRVAWNRGGVVVFRSLCWMMIFWKRESIGVGFRVLEP